MSDEELRQAFIESQEDAITGIIRSDGIIRKYARKISKITNNSLSTPLSLTCIEVCYQIACRWSKQEIKKTDIKEEQS